MHTQHVRTTCTRDCPAACGLVAEVRDGRIVKLTGDPDHPLTKGKACAKTSAYIERVYHPERITVPLIRDAKHGPWRRASWDEALGTVAERLTSVVAESGPEAILYYQGYGERTALKLLNAYFFRQLGGVTTLRGSLCSGTGFAAQGEDLGERISHDPLDHLNAKAVVLWGRNPVTTQISMLPILKELKDRGAPVLLIDPVSTKTAALATRRIMPRPGADGCLALAAAKLLLASGRADEGFLATRCENSDAFLRLLDSLDLDELILRADVPRADVDYLADLLAEHDPTAILLGWGLHRHVEGHQSIRAIDALGAVAGVFCKPGGGVSQGFEEYGPYDPRWWGEELTPERRTLLLPRIGEEILTARDPQIRMAVVTAANPVTMAPDTVTVQRAFAGLEFLVYSGHFLDDTASLADVFLPATTFLEEEDAMASYGHNYIGPVNPAIAPVGECRPEFKTFQELARRCGFGETFAGEAKEWTERICAPVWGLGHTPEALRRGALRLDPPMVPYADGKFLTESGKFRFLESFDTTIAEAEDSAEYPYRLMSVAPHGVVCSERTMDWHAPHPLVRLHPQEAERLGLADGDLVDVSSILDSVRCRLVLDEGLRRDVLASERGGWLRAGHGLNRLNPARASTLGEGTPYNETRVAVSRAEGEAVGKRILVVQHSSIAPAGQFGLELVRLGCALETLDLEAGEALPASTDGYAGLLVLGGPQSPADDAGNPHYPELFALLRAFDTAGKPVAGLCLGCQLLARAHGGEAFTMAELEFGYLRPRWTEAAATDPVLGALAQEDAPALLEFHEASYTLPEGATLLLTGETGIPQAFRVGNCSYGFQFHLEADAVIAHEFTEILRNGTSETYRRYQRQFDAAYFEELRPMLPVLAQATEEFRAGVVRGWLGLA